jgi:hypothetical protein
MVPDTLTEGLKMAVSDSVQLSAPGDDVQTAVHLSLFFFMVNVWNVRISDSFQILKEETKNLYCKVFLEYF